MLIFHFCRRHAFCLRVVGMMFSLLAVGFVFACRRYFDCLPAVGYVECLRSGYFVCSSPVFDRLHACLPAVGVLTACLPSGTWLPLCRQPHRKYFVCPLAVFFFTLFL